VTTEHYFVCCELKRDGEHLEYFERFN